MLDVLSLGLHSSNTCLSLRVSLLQAWGHTTSVHEFDRIHSRWYIIFRCSPCSLLLPETARAVTRRSTAEEPSIAVRYLFPVVDPILMSMFASRLCLWHHACLLLCVGANGLGRGVGLWVSLGTAERCNTSLHILYKPLANSQIQLAKSASLRVMYVQCQEQHRCHVTPRDTKEAPTTQAYTPTLVHGIPE